MKFFDLHADTLYKLYWDKAPLLENERHVSLRKAKNFENYAESFVYFCSPKLNNDDGYDAYLKAYERLESEVNSNNGKAAIVRNSDELKIAFEDRKVAILPAVEDARILGNDLDRLQTIKKNGSWYLTLLWGGDTVIGGSHDTENGLTDFGKDVVKKCCELRITPDISHASEKSADDILAIGYEYNKPVIASHSNSYTVYSHSRNLRDRHLADIKALGGIVGFSLCRSHLADKPSDTTDITDVIRHVEYYMSNGCENTLCMGADWDGTALPRGFSDIRDTEKIKEELAHLNYSEEILDKIFFKNAFDFYTKHN